MARGASLGQVVGVLLWADPFGLGWRAVFLVNVAIGAVLLITGLAGTLGGLVTAGDHEHGWLPAAAIGRAWP